MTNIRLKNLPVRVRRLVEAAAIAAGIDPGDAWRAHRVSAVEFGEARARTRLALIPDVSADDAVIEFMDAWNSDVRDHINSLLEA